MLAMKTKGWMGTVALAALLGATGCSKNEGDGGGGGGSSNASKLEEYASTPLVNLSLPSLAVLMYWA